MFVFVRVCACVFCGRTIFFFAGGAFKISRPRGPWFLNPSMGVTVSIQLYITCLSLHMHFTDDLEEENDLFTRSVNSGTIQYCSSVLHKSIKKRNYVCWLASLESNHICEIQNVLLEMLKHQAFLVRRELLVKHMNISE